MKNLKSDNDYLLKIRYLYKLKNRGINNINTDIDFKNSYFDYKKRWL